MPGAGRKNIYSEIKESLFKDLIQPLLKDGGPLPSKKEMAERYKVNIGTLDKALQELSIEGFVEKRIGSGTYVLPQNAGEQGEIGVLFGCWRDKDASKVEFNFKLDGFLQEQLSSAGREFRHYADTRIEQLRDKPLKHLAEDIDRRKLSALIVNRCDTRLRPWLEKLSIPVILMEHDFGWGAVSHDWRSVGFEAASILANAGCESIELLSSFIHEWEGHSEVDAVNRPLRAGMANALRPKGLRAPDCWLKPDMLPEEMRKSGYAGRSDELVGAELCKALFKHATPDGLAIYTDNLAKGVAKGLSEMGLKLGSDVRCVSIGSKELDFPWLEGFIRLDFSIEELASKMIELAVAAERREAPKEIYLQCKQWK